MVPTRMPRESERLHDSRASSRKADPAYNLTAVSAKRDLLLGCDPGTSRKTKYAS